MKAIKDNDLLKRQAQYIIEKHQSRNLIWDVERLKKHTTALVSNVFPDETTAQNYLLKVILCCEAKENHKSFCVVAARRTTGQTHFPICRKH